MSRQALRAISDGLAVFHHLHPTTATHPQVQQAHAHLLKTGHSTDNHLATKLLSLYSALHHFRDACRVLSSLLDPDHVCFSNLISSLSKSDNPSSAIALFRRMLLAGIAPDSFVFPSVVKACACTASSQTGRQAHALASVLGFSCDSFVESSLVHMYLKCGLMEDARKVFDGMNERNVVSWSAMIAGYARQGCSGEALTLLSRMCHSGVEPNLVTWNGLIAGFSANGNSEDAVFLIQKMFLEGFSPDRVTFSSVLPAIGNLGYVIAGMQVHGYVIKYGIRWDACVVSALIDMYGKCLCTENMIRAFEEVVSIDVASCNALLSGLSRNGQVDEALKKFKEFESQGFELNVISWTSIISCCAQNGKDIVALEFFQEMQDAGISPNCITIPCVLPACANIAALRHGKSIHCFSLRRSFIHDVHVGSALLDVYAKCGRIDNARRVFDVMPERNVVSWNAMIGGYAMHGKSKGAMDLFQLMQSCGAKPDGITFSCVLSACSQTGLVSEGLRYFDNMQQDYGIMPRMEHYACIVSLHGRVGNLEEAYSTIKQMTLEPDACIWGALLSSCRLHGHLTLGQIAAENLFKLEPMNIGNYILLANIYASKGMNYEVDRIRENMKSMGLRKNPGCSWTEVNNKVHILLAGDRSHPQMNQILERLEGLGMEMKKQGYVPSTIHVMQDVDEQDKEQILCGHSEKLALAVGLLNSGPQTPLMIIKNLRICGDCHTAIKFVSSFENREILVRDTNRFHHFKGGTCSCGDHW